MKTAKFLAAAAICSALASAFAGCSDDSKNEANSSKSGAVAASQAAQISSRATDAAAAATTTGATKSHDFTLLAENGATKTLADFAGEKLVVYFGYTLCADVCPTSLGIAGDALAELGATGVRLLFITLDPDRDKATDLGEYARYFWPAAEGLVPSHEELARLAKTYGVKFAYIKQDSAADYTVAHSSSFYLIDEQGKFVGEVSNLARKNVLKKFAQFLQQN